MEEIDAAWLEPPDRFVEGRAHELGKTPIMRVIIPGEFLEYLLPVETGMSIAAPVVDRKASGLEPGALDRLGERGVRISLVRSELNEDFSADERRQSKMRTEYAQPRRPARQACQGRRR